MSNASIYSIPCIDDDKITTPKRKTLLSFLVPMATISKFTMIKTQTKSISLPCRSHPTTFEIEELLNKIKITVPVAETASAEAICRDLSRLTGLYKCMNKLLTSSTTQLLMSHGENKKWVDELVDESVEFLDVCGGISDMLLEIKDHSRDLVGALRRKGGKLVIDNSIVKYNCFRKKMKKDVKLLVGRLKQADNMINNGGSSVVVGSDNHQLAAVIRAVIGVSEVTILVFESLLTFFSGSVSNSKPNRWSVVVSKLMHRGMVACEDQKEHETVDELGSIDAALRLLCKYGFSSESGNAQIAQCRLERLVVEIESMESGLECIFKFLVRTRVSLLNIVSQ